MSFELIYYRIKIDYCTIGLGLYVQREVKTQEGNSKGRWKAEAEGKKKNPCSSTYTRQNSWRPKKPDKYIARNR